MISRLVAATAIATAFWTAPAKSAEQVWRLVDSASSLTFSYIEDDAPAEGRFNTFSGSARVDFNDLSTAAVDVLVDIASITMADPVRTHFAQSIDWFHTEAYPEARFQLTGLTPAPSGGYQATGDLTIKGVTIPVATDVTLTGGEESLTAAGRISFQRTAFKLGIGFSSLFNTVGDEIIVSFSLTGERIAR